VSVIVRTAGRRDLDAIHALWRELREEQAKADPRLALARESDVQAREHREVILADPRTRLLVAEEGGDVLGYLHAQVDQLDPVYARARVGRLVDVVVRPDHRRQGVGTRLLEGGRDWLRSLGLVEMRVSVPVFADGAERFFQRSGAVRIESTLAMTLEEDA
jgi:GNAT superfamily N-acetyltransferase